MNKIIAKNPTIKELLNNWDNGIVNLNRGNGLFIRNNLRLRHCSLHYNNVAGQYYIKYLGTDYGLPDIYDLRRN
jgi:hypothetical protein